MSPQEQDRVLLAMALVVDAATSLSLDSAEDRRELKRRLGAAVFRANPRVAPGSVMVRDEHGQVTGPFPLHLTAPIRTATITGIKASVQCPFCYTGVLKTHDGVESCDECGASAPATE